jgi:alkylation response protein AidB-like acyl-CoA dehydrogenase
MLGGDLSVMINNRYIFDEEHELFRESVRRFVGAEIAPRYDDWCRAGESPRSLYDQAGRPGLLSPQVPDKYCGPGLDFRFNAIVNEEVNYGGFPCPNQIGRSDL